MRILLIDNYDSFTYNLVHTLKELTGGEDRLEIVRHDEDVLGAAAVCDKIILSPGPGVPEEAGLLLSLIECYGPVRPILGVCLGHQALAQVYGAEIVNLDRVFHGVSSTIRILKKEYLFEGLPDRLGVGRYHSWGVDRAGFPDCLEITAVDEEGMIMALSHRDHDLHGVQFHPESILTPDGKKILANFLAHRMPS